MSSGNIIRKSPGELQAGDSDWAKVDALSDADIDAAMADDADTSKWSVEDSANARFLQPLEMLGVGLIETDLLAWYASAGDGWERQVNQVLRDHATAHGMGRRA